MIFPARYGRLWSVATAAILFIIIVVVLRGGPSQETLSSIPGLPLGEDEKIPEPPSPDRPGLRPAVPPEPPAHTTPQTTRQGMVVHTTTLFHSESASASSSSSSSSSAAAAEETTTQDAGMRVGIQTAPNIQPPQPQETPANAGNLVQPGIQPDPTPTAALPGSTLADGAGFLINPDVTQIFGIDDAAASSMSISISASTSVEAPEPTTMVTSLTNGGILGQPGIQPEPSTQGGGAAVTRIADDAAVIIEAPTSATPAPSISSSSSSSSAAIPSSTGISKAAVMGKLRTENTDWVQQELPDWAHAIYAVDLPSDAPLPADTLRTKMNKAREAMPYLTYILDNYPHFPDVVAFIHPHKTGMPKAWHNDARGHNAVHMLEDLQLEEVVRRGYVNLRCNNEVGCPEEIRPFRDPPDPSKHAEHAYPLVYAAFFNKTFPQMREEIPVIGTQCCAQFAVSRAQLLKRPREEYEAYRRYLEETELDDATIGRVMEYMWHIIFGREAVHCENVYRCWCEVYGKCTARELRELLDVDPER